MVTHEKFTPPPEIRAALAALPAPTAFDYLSRLQCAPLEVVVIARRVAGSERLRDQIDSILVERTEKPIRAAVRRHSSAPWGEMVEAERETMVLFWESLQSESFLEVRFNLALMRLAQWAGRKIRGGEQGDFERSVELFGSRDSEDSDGREGSMDIPSNAEEYSRLEDQDLIEVGLASLPKEQARAITLHYRMGLQIFSQDPTVPTLASVLGCGERKARQLIADGRAGLRRSIGQEDEDD